jgi:hypothetical protein
MAQPNLPRVVALAALIAFAASQAFAATTTSPSTTVLSVVGHAPGACTLGVAGNKTLNIGEMVDPTTGELANITNPPSTSIAGSWCNTASTLTVLATPLVAQSFVGAPPSGFTKAVNYTATVSAWTTNPATFATNGDVSGVQHNNSPGSQSQSSPSSATMVVSIGSFASPGAGDFLVADPNYNGTITITLTPNS